MGRGEGRGGRARPRATGEQADAVPEHAWGVPPSESDANAGPNRTASRGSRYNSPIPASPLTADAAGGSIKIPAPIATPRFPDMKPIVALSLVACLLGV